MKNLSKLFYRKASLALAIAFTLLSFSYLFLIMMDTAKCFQFGSGTESLSMSFGLTQELVQGFFSARSKEMVECFKAFNLIWDNVFPLLYGVMYTCWLSLIYKPFSHKAKLLNFAALRSSPIRLVRELHDGRLFQCDPQCGVDFK